MAVVLLLIYVAFCVFSIWAVLSIVKSLSRTADAQRETAAALGDVAQALRK